MPAKSSSRDAITELTVGFFADAASLGAAVVAAAAAAVGVDSDDGGATTVPGTVTTAHTTITRPCFPRNTS
jgi:hypothetical protein